MFRVPHGLGFFPEHFRLMDQKSGRFHNIEIYLTIGYDGFAVKSGYHEEDA